MISGIFQRRVGRATPCAPTTAKAFATKSGSCRFSLGNGIVEGFYFVPFVPFCGHSNAVLAWTAAPSEHCILLGKSRKGRTFVRPFKMRTKFFMLWLTRAAPQTNALNRTHRTLHFAPSTPLTYPNPCPPPVTSTGYTAGVTTGDSGKARF